MSEMYLDGQVLVGSATFGMSLVFNRTNTSKKVTADGHMLGGKEKAWVTADDSVLLNEINSGTLKLITDGNIVTSDNTFDVFASPVRTRKSKRQ